MKVNSQYMHLLHFSMKLKRETTMERILEKLEANDRISITDKINSCEVFHLEEIMDTLEEY